MWNKHQNKKQKYTHFQLPNKLFQVHFFSLYNLDLNIRNSESISIFKSKLLSFIRPVQTNIYNIFDPKGLTFLTRLRLGLSHLNEHRFRHNFQDCLNPLCSCSLEIEGTSHYLLHCHYFSHHRVVFMNSVKSVCDNFDSMSDHGFMDFSRYKSMVWKCQRIFTFVRWLAIWWKQRYYFEGNYKLLKKYWKILWISFLLMFHYWLMSNFLPKFQTTQLLTFSVPIIARI